MKKAEAKEKRLVIMKSKENVIFYGWCARKFLTNIFEILIKLEGITFCTGIYGLRVRT